MVPKQEEMDDMVRTIYSAIENEDHLANTLFVLCGDHGMNEGGNHGGSSEGETSPALVFMSPKLTKVTGQLRKESPIKPKAGSEFEYYRLVEQSDIAPTLAGLLGFPVPQNNLGVFLKEFLGFWGNFQCHVSFKDRKLTFTGGHGKLFLYPNARQIKKIVEAKYPGLSFDEGILQPGKVRADCNQSKVGSYV
jgi:ethanolaminephosphotransferase